MSRPSGDHCGFDSTPAGAFVSRRARPPSAGATHTRRSSRRPLFETKASQRPSGEKTGSSSSDSPSVIARGLPPLTERRYSLSHPVSCRTKASDLPSGDHETRRIDQPPPRSCGASCNTLATSLKRPVFTSKSASLKRPLKYSGDRSTYAIFVPSGDHAGLPSSAGADVSRLVVNPSALTTARSPFPRRPVSKTIHLPFGDQRGDRSAAVRGSPEPRAPSVNRTGSPPPAGPDQIAPPLA